MEREKLLNIKDVSPDVKFFTVCQVARYCNLEDDHEAYSKINEYADNRHFKRRHLSGLGMKAPKLRLYTREEAETICEYYNTKRMARYEVKQLDFKMPCAEKNCLEFDAKKFSISYSDGIIKLTPKE